MPDKATLGSVCDINDLIFQVFWKKWFYTGGNLKYMRDACLLKCLQIRCTLEVTKVELIEDFVHFN